MNTAAGTAFDDIRRMLDRVEEAARKGGEDSGWLFLFGAKVLSLCTENDDLRRQVNSGRGYREVQEGLPEGTLPRV